MRELTRRDFLRLSVAGATGAIVAGCQPATPQIVEVEKVVKETVVVEKEVTVAPKAAEGPARIRFAAHGDWGWLSVWLARIDEFNAEHEGEIVVAFEHSVGQIWSKYMTQMAAGIAADVIRWEAKRAPEWMERGEQLLDLTAYYEADPDMKAEDYFEILWNDCWYKGKLIQVPYDTSTVTLWYNRNIFQERGVEFPPSEWDDPRWTWETFMETCEKLTFGEGPEKVFGTNFNRWWVYTHPWVWSNGGEIVVPGTTDVKIDMAETVEAWQFIADFTSKYNYAPMPDQATEGLSAFFETGRTATLITSSSYNRRAELVTKETGLDWDLAPIPSHNGKPTYTRSPNNSIACYAGTPQPDAAWEFAKFMSSEKCQAAGGKSIVRATPSRKAVAMGPFLERTAVNNWKVQADGLVKHVKVEPRTPYFERFNRELDDGWHEVFDGVKEAEVAVNELKPRLEAILRGEDI